MISGWQARQGRQAGCIWRITHPLHCPTTDSNGRLHLAQHSPIALQPIQTAGCIWRNTHPLFCRMSTGGDACSGGGRPSRREPFSCECVPCMQNHKCHSSVLHSPCVGLAITIHIRCMYGKFGREITKYTVIYGEYVRFWPTLCNIYGFHMLCIYTGLANAM